MFQIIKKIFKTLILFSKNSGLSLLEYENLEPIDPIYALPSKLTRKLNLPNAKTFNIIKK